MIAHFDIDAFYASVAQLDDPGLLGFPLVVAGSSRRAVVLTASYEARPFGVHSAMPLYQALERCPQLIVVRPNFERYRALSRAVFAIFEEESQTIEGLSLDEAFVDLGPIDLTQAHARAAAIRERIRADIGLSISAGVAAQMMVAKIACDEAKPNGLLSIEPGTGAAYLAPKSVSLLWGVGPKTHARLLAEKIETIGQLAALDDAHLAALFGRSGRHLRDLAQGNDTREVTSERETRSVSSEQTFEYDLHNPTEMRAAIQEASEDVATRLRAHALRASTVGIKIKRADFITVGRQTTLEQPTDDPTLINAAAQTCLDRIDLKGHPVRLIGVRAASLTEEATLQTS
ncbi:MAG TPA: DNA polymerase IV, partial [Candidatus Baltobacteraceae bacterium]